MNSKDMTTKINSLRVIQLGLIALAIPIYSFLAPTAATAQTNGKVKTPTTSQVNLTVIPNALVIAGTRNTVETRNLVLKASSTVNNLKIIPLDINRIDQLKVIPSANIGIKGVKNIQITANSPALVPINVNLNNIAASGEYNGVLLILYPGGETTIPITIKVREPIWLALIPLIIGVLLGYSLSRYQEEGLDRDEVLVQVGKIRREIQGDEDFKLAFEEKNSSATSINPFLTKINAYLIDVDTALESKQWNEARQAANQARQVWNNWLKGKPNWLKLLKYKQEELDTHLKDDNLSPNIPYGKAVKAKLENAVSRIADWEKPEDFQQELEQIKEQIDNYHEGQRMLNQLNVLRNNVPNNDREHWRSQIAALQNNLEYLLPNEDKYQEWKQTAEQVMDELSNEIETAKSIEARGAETSLIAARNIQNAENPIAPVQNLPILTSGTNKQTPEEAAQRLRTARIAGHIIAITFLSLLGFNQLYWSNLTFGANPVGDYFSLLAWGFGAEVTRESVTKVLQGLRIPGVK